MTGLGHCACGRPAGARGLLQGEVTNGEVSAEFAAALRERDRKPAAGSDRGRPIGWFLELGEVECSLQ
jgi:hypothetical protein